MSLYSMRFDSTPKLVVKVTHLASEICVLLLAAFCSLECPRSAGHILGICDDRNQYPRYSPAKKNPWLQVTWALNHGGFPPQSIMHVFPVLPSLRDALSHLYPRPSPGGGNGIAVEMSSDLLFYCPRK